MRCRLGEKKLKKYSEKFGKDFTLGLVRGSTNHRVDLYTVEESFSYYPYLMTIEDNKRIEKRDVLVLNKGEKGRPRETIPAYKTAVDFIVTMKQTSTNIQKGE